MKLDKFKALPRTDDGRTIVTLMHDPAMTDAEGNGVGFLSVVNRGANGRTFTVCKADGASSLDNADGPTFMADVVPGLGGRVWGFLRGVFGPLLGLAAPAAKSDAPVTFEAALVGPMLREGLWKGGDALADVVRNILADETITDKKPMIAAAIDAYKAYLLDLADKTLSMKAEDAAELAAHLNAHPELVFKAGRVISATNLATLTTAQEALQAALTAVQALIKAGSTDTPTTKTDPEDTMNAQQLALAAEAAGLAAVSLARKSGEKDEAKLQAIGQAATAQALKDFAFSPVGIGAQPSLAGDAFASQRAQAPGSGTPDFQSMIDAALAKVSGQITTKLDELGARMGAVEVAVKGDGAADPGLVGVVRKQGEVQATLARKVAEIQATPAPARGGGKGTDHERTTTSKADPFTGTALSGTPAGK